MKKIMILGAGIYQVPLIQKAKEMGLYTIVVSVPGEYPGFAFADKIYELDTRDCEGILAAAQKECIDGICTSGTDVAVAAIGYVCDQMGLHGVSYEAASLVTDKWKMKEAFAARGVCSAPFIKIERSMWNMEKGAKAAAGKDANPTSPQTKWKRQLESLGYPLVIKAVDSSGSRGIHIVREASQWEMAVDSAFAVTKKDYILAEAFTKGEEIGVDGFVQDGKLVLLKPHGKYMFRGAKATVPAGHIFPYTCSAKTEKEIFRQMELAVRATGVDHCAVNADVFVDGDQVSIIEMGARTGATCIPELMEVHCGYSLYEKMIQNALGEEPVFPQKESEAGIPCCARLLFSKIAGKLTHIHEDKLQRIRERGVQIRLDYPLGHAVETMENGTNRLGHVIAEATGDAFEEIYRQVQSCICVDGQTLEEQWRS